MNVSARLRRFWLDVHLWLGAALFVPFAILGITGSVLTFHDELERLSAPQRYEISAGAPLSLATQIEHARVALDAAFVVTAVRPPERADAPVLVQARVTTQPAAGQRPETRTVFLDPATGRVLDTTNPRADVFGILHGLHGTLLIPDIGRKLVGWLGWAMLISSLTGIWLWWPRHPPVWRGLRWRRSARTTTNLHHLTGFWIAIPLAVLSLTGIYISFPQLSRNVLGAFVDVPPNPPPGIGGRNAALPIVAPHLTADAAAQAALAAAPQGRLISVTLPTRGRDDDAPAWRVQVHLAGAEANSTLNVNDESGAVKMRGDPAPSADQNAARFMRRLHDGTDFGIVWRIIIALAGLAPALLGVTGLTMWLRRRGARRALKRGRPAMSHPVA